MLHSYQHTVPLSEVADTIWHGNAIVGSHGSATNDHGTYSYVILIDTHTDSPQMAIQCGGNLPILTEYIDMDSHLFWTTRALLKTTSPGTTIQ
jgi:hypothetical protein